MKAFPWFEIRTTRTSRITWRAALANLRTRRILLRICQTLPPAPAPPPLSFTLASKEEEKIYR
jgi:hypothetical protein